MRQVGGIGNRLLAALPSADFDLLAPELETVALLEDASISHNGDPVDYVLFPHSGAVSLMVDLADGQTVASALIGREGAIGTLSVFGPSSSALTAIVRAAGTASRIPARQFHAAFQRSSAIRHAIQIHIRAMLVQLQRGGACNALHPVQARMARWLMHICDRIDDDVLPLTQEALSQMLGVRRTTVTLLMRNLRASGAIRSDRRGRIEIDRARLAAAACECHGTMHREVEQIFSTKYGATSRIDYADRHSG
ncbi:Crp/Fnr family transcriptional regulator [Bradyrhizobium huanghuaihaiense]|uniref:Crp/Fnr family transcriptional regulator n=1 Tax=Bradyrhizobium huanghuaihaiense TaxID=990078 RepID=UPI00037238F6|nr:Crp/Fnr family transcriptional regulator [Bradyrhizobium huanghuaihaiense]